MARQINFTLNQTTVGIGQHILGPANTPLAATAVHFNIQQFSWPHTGGEAFHYSVEESIDGGNTWVASPTFTVMDIAIPAKFQNPANNISDSRPIMFPGVAGSKIRVNSTFAKTLTISAQIQTE